MNKLVENLAALLSRIWLTPERALVMVRERDISWEIAYVRGASSRAA